MLGIKVHVNKARLVYSGQAAAQVSGKTPPGSGFTLVLA
jgi:hypothetical protein